ncbi:MAG: hypothetical protein WEA59_09990 [Ferruginibacter sp.]
MSNYNQDQLTSLNVQYDSDAKNSLFNMGKWARFLSWSIFIFSILFVFIFILSATVFRNSLGDVIPFFKEIGTTPYITIGLGIIVTLSIFLSAFYFLFNFSTKIKQGLLTEDTPTINTGLKSLKIYFIISTVISALALLINFFNIIF